MATVGTAQQIDLISPPEDRYLVRLLAQALEFQGIQVHLRSPGDAPTSPIGLAVLRDDDLSAADWRPLLDQYPQASLLAFSNSRQAQQANAFVLLGWPARSSDAAVAELARLLSAGRAPGNAADAATPGRWQRWQRQPDSASGRATRTKAVEPSPVAVLLGLLLLIGLAVLLMMDLSESPAPDQAGHNAPPTVESIGRSGAAASPTASSTARTEDDLQVSSAASVAASVPGGIEPRPDQIKSRAPVALPLNSTLQRFCDATTLAAAKAWLEAFNWQDYWHWHHEPCMPRNLPKDDYQSLLLRLQRASHGMA